MRIIAGNLGGRVFDSPKNRRTHPMSDRVRGALFNTLGDIAGLSVLDAFAGSGALSFEAVSRGARSAVAIDIDKSAHAVILQNASKLGLQTAVKAIRANASGWSDNNQGERFDIVFAAPPYDDTQAPLIQKLTRHVSESGIFVLDWPGNLDPPVLTGLQLIQQKSFGDAQLVFYERIP